MSNVNNDIKIKKFVEEYYDTPHTHTHTHTSPTLIEILKQTVPQFFKDGVFDKDAFLHEFDGSSKNEEKYGFSWSGKNKAIEIANVQSTNTLKANKEKSLNFDESENIIISGDNLEVLKILSKSYSNSVDVIYIDPPYNTGNDFIYNDNFKMSKDEIDDLNDKNMSKNQKSSSINHTNWLNMIYPRLKISRQLLKYDGIIFISIDDNEQSRLKIICDEIFGEQNFIANLPRLTVRGGKTQTNFISINNDYVLIYAKNKKDTSLNKIEISDLKDFKFKDSHFEKRGFYHTKQALDSNTLGYIKSLDYEIIHDGISYYPGGEESYLLRKDKKTKNNEWRWTWSKERFDFALKNDFVEFKNGRIFPKKYFNAEIKEKENKEYEISYIERKKPFSTLDIIDNRFSNPNGSKDLEKILEKNTFNNPKPVELIKIFLKLILNKRALVLDFFAGSGTTGQAVMELNKEDDGNRKYILVQLPEKIENSEFETIADITRERIKRSIEMYDYKEKGFKFYELNSSNLTAIDDSNAYSTLFDKPIKENRTSEEILTEIILKIGLDLNTKIEFVKKENISYWIDENKSNVFFIEKISYDRNIIDETFKIWKNKNELGTLKVFFRSDCFLNDSFNKYIKSTIESFSENGSITWMEI